MSTKSFIISLPIITGDQDRRRLQKCFSFGCNLQNAVMGGGWDRVLKMRATAEWQTARAMPKSSERTKAFRDLRVERVRLSCRRRHAPQGFGTRPLTRHQRMSKARFESVDLGGTPPLQRRLSEVHQFSTRTAFDRREDQSHRHHLESRSAVRNRLQARVPCSR